MHNVFVLHWMIDGLSGSDRFDQIKLASVGRSVEAERSDNRGESDGLKFHV